MCVKVRNFCSDELVNLLLELIWVVLQLSKGVWMRGGREGGSGGLRTGERRRREEEEEEEEEV